MEVQPFLEPLKLHHRTSCPKYLSSLNQNPNVHWLMCISRRLNEAIEYMREPSIKSTRIEIRQMPVRDSSDYLLRVR